MRNVFLVLIISLFTINLEAQSFNEILKLVSGDLGQAHSFGYSISIDGDYALVGALNAGTPTNPFGKQGSAYIFSKDVNGQWQEIKKLVASDGFDLDYFGASVNISGDYAIVGAYQEDEDANGANNLSEAGAAYIFYRNEGGTENWGEVKKLVASDRDANDNFGRSVGIHGNYVVVGANYEQHDINGSNSMSNAGSAYIFEKDAGGADNWGEVKKLVPSDRGGSDDFGRNVLINNDFIVIAASGQKLDDSGSNSLNGAGAVYIFDRNEGGTNNWGEIRKIVASDRATNNRFGSSIAMDDDYLVIGAQFATANSVPFSGAAYVFKRDIVLGTPNWSEFKKLEASDANSDDKFGYAIDISGDNIIVGSFQEDEDLNDENTLNNAGAAYIFNKNEGGIDNWGETQKIVPIDRATNNFFGFSVAIEDDLVLIGATRANNFFPGGSSLNGGAIYVFEYGLPSSIKSISNLSRIEVYPNPVQNTLNISSKKTFKWVTIYNAIGQPIKRFSIQKNQMEISVSDLPKGTYILQLITENGQSVTKQIIKN